MKRSTVSNSAKDNHNEIIFPFPDQVKGTKRISTSSGLQDSRKEMLYPFPDQVNRGTKAIGKRAELYDMVNFITENQRPQSNQPNKEQQHIANLKQPTHPGQLVKPVMPHPVQHTSEIMTLSKVPNPSLIFYQVPLVQPLLYQHSRPDSHILNLNIQSQYHQQILLQHQHRENMLSERHMDLQQKQQNNQLILDQSQLQYHQQAVTGRQITERGGPDFELKKDSQKTELELFGAKTISVHEDLNELQIDTAKTTEELNIEETDTPLPTSIHSERTNSSKSPIKIKVQVPNDLSQTKQSGLLNIQFTFLTYSANANFAMLSGSN